MAAMLSGFSRRARPPTFAGSPNRICSTSCPRAHTCSSTTMWRTSKGSFGSGIPLSTVGSATIVTQACAKLNRHATICKACSTLPGFHSSPILCPGLWPYSAAPPFVFAPFCFVPRTPSLITVLPLVQRCVDDPRRQRPRSRREQPVPIRHRSAGLCVPCRTGGPLAGAATTGNNWRLIRK